MNKEWQELKPLCTDYFSNVVSYHASKLIVAAEMQTNWVGSRNKLCCYDTKTDSWTDLMDIKNKHLDTALKTYVDESSIVLNTQQSHLYMMTPDSTLVIIDLNELSVVHVTDVMPWDSHSQRNNYGSALFANDKFYTFCGSETNEFWTVYNNKSHKLASLNNLQCLDGFGYAHIANYFYLFGGWNGDEEVELHQDSVFQYSLEQNTWRKLDVELPIGRAYFGCCAVIRNQYVLMFGGFGYEFGQSKDIVVFDVANETFKTSPIQCPKKTNYRAVSICDEKEDTLIVFGFIRSMWKEKKLKIDFPHSDLINMIASYFLREFVHLLDWEEANTGHWKRSSLNIVESVFSSYNH